MENELAEYFKSEADVFANSAFWNTRNIHNYNKFTSSIVFIQRLISLKSSRSKIVLTFPNKLKIVLKTCPYTHNALEIWDYTQPANKTLIYSYFTYNHLRINNIVYETDEEDLTTKYVCICTEKHAFSFSISTTNHSGSTQYSASLDPIFIKPFSEYLVDHGNFIIDACFSCFNQTKLVLLAFDSIVILRNNEVKKVLLHDFDFGRKMIFTSVCTDPYNDNFLHLAGNGLVLIDYLDLTFKIYCSALDMIDSKNDLCFTSIKNLNENPDYWIGVVSSVHSCIIYKINDESIYVISRVALPIFVDFFYIYSNVLLLKQCSSSNKNIKNSSGDTSYVVILEIADSFFKSLKKHSIVIYFTIPAQQTLLNLLNNKYDLRLSNYMDYIHVCLSCFLFRDKKSACSNFKALIAGNEVVNQAEKIFINQSLQVKKFYHETASSDFYNQYENGVRLKKIQTCNSSTVYINLELLVNVIKGYYSSQVEDGKIKINWYSNNLAALDALSVYNIDEFYRKVSFSFHPFSKPYPFCTCGLFQNGEIKSTYLSENDYQKTFFPASTSLNLYDIPENKDLYNIFNYPFYTIKSHPSNNHLSDNLNLYANCLRRSKTCIYADDNNDLYEFYTNCTNSFRKNCTDEEETDIKIFCNTLFEDWPVSKRLPIINIDTTLPRLSNLSGVIKEVAKLIYKSE